MVRVMVTVMPFAGHVGPLRPVVAELVARGHEVRVHTGRRYLEPFRAAGARVVPWQAAADFDENDLPATFPAAQEGKGPRQMLGHLRHVFVGTAAGQARDLTAAWADEPWDVLLGDTTSFGSDLPAHVHFVGRMDAPPPAVSSLPSWWDEVAQSDRPVVHVTQGTFNADPTQLLLPTLEALADDPVLVVATTGRAGSRSLPDAVPPNAHVTDLLPYSELLPRTTVMVTNGGWGGVTAALAHGVPLVVAGGDIDKPEIAARVAWSGAGIDLRTGTPTPAAVRDAVRSVLTGASFRAAAARVAAGFAAHDGPREAADLLEQLAAQQAPVRRPVAQLWG